MNITTGKDSAAYLLHLEGRLDASWCDHVQGTLDKAIKDGQHHLHLDMSQVSYLSSAGIRVLLKIFKQLTSIEGSLKIVRSSDFVANVLELAGLNDLVAGESASPDESEAEERIHESEYAQLALHSPAGSLPQVNVRVIGDPESLRTGAPQKDRETLAFAASHFAIGVGALGNRSTETDPRMGEFLALAGVAAYQPTDGSNRPDYMLSEGALIPEGQLLLGLSGDSLPSGLARFETKADHRTVPMSDLCQAALDLSQSDAAVLVALTETAGLVSTTLQQSPANAVASEPERRFSFPGVRDWLSYSGERIHRDSNSLIVGVVARPGTALDPMLRPLRPGGSLLGHLHAATFPYHPIRKGKIALADSVADLFSRDSLQSIAHLISDPREITGAGESEFYRGALWHAPLQLTQSN